MFGKKKKAAVVEPKVEAEVESSVLDANIGTSKVAEPAKFKQPELTERQKEVLAVYEDLMADYSLVSPSGLVSMPVAERDAFLVNVLLSLALEVRQLRKAVEKANEED